MGKLSWVKKACGVFLVCATAAVALPAQTTGDAPAGPTLTLLHSFDSTDGANPFASLVQATNGDVYGTTVFGGANGDGTVFKISPNGTLTTLHSFDYADGADPYSALVQATNGDFYGTTYYGGASNACGHGCGTVFKITPSGTLTTLHNFDGTDGTYPNAVLVLATDGNFYGTTTYGGASNFCVHGCGTVFKIIPTGTLTTLHSFDGMDGGGIVAGLIQATNGDFYGTTYNGGAGHACANRCGTVFKINPSGTLSTLHSFDGTDGATPTAGLVQATNGDFYGTTEYGGANSAGTVFKITAGGVLTRLYSFCPQVGCPDGEYPIAGLVQGTNGSFYGTTYFGGANSDGAVFKITPSGTLTTLHSFSGTDGSIPYAGLVQATNGDFYGTTYNGGANGDGTVFSLSVALGPFVATNPTSGKVGTAVHILGTNLTGTTSVTFNGTVAAFTVKSKSEITTTVPTGATTGTVQVVTPGGTLSSNVPFRVR